MSTSRTDRNIYDCARLHSFQPTDSDDPFFEYMYCTPYSDDTTVVSHVDTHDSMNSVDYSTRNDRRRRLLDTSKLSWGTWSTRASRRIRTVSISPRLYDEDIHWFRIWSELIRTSLALHSTLWTKVVLSLFWTAFLLLLEIYVFTFSNNLSDSERGQNVFLRMIESHNHTIYDTTDKENCDFFFSILKVFPHTHTLSLSLFLKRRFTFSTFLRDSLLLKQSTIWLHLKSCNNTG